jgi:hypothetical protein
MVYMSCCYLHGVQTVDLLRSMARYTIQPLYLNKSDDAATRITSYYGRVSGPFEVRLHSCDRTLLKGKNYFLKGKTILYQQIMSWLNLNEMYTPQIFRSILLSTLPVLLGHAANCNCLKILFVYSRLSNFLAIW